MSDTISVSQVIDKFASRFCPENAVGVTTCYQFILDDADDFYLDIADQQCQALRGEHDDPDITLITNSETFIRIVNGETDGMSAYLKGSLRAEGNIMLATKLSKLFKR